MNSSILLRCLPTLLLLPLGLAAQTAATNNQPAPPAEESVRLNPFEVTATSDKGYGALYNMAGSRINTSSLDEPSSVITINQQLLQDVAPEEPIDALQWVSGVSNTIGQYSSEFTIRGFQIATYDFVDGLPGQTGLSGDNFIDMATIERVEVVKGPAGVQYGATSLGGVVDTITKKPLAYNQTILTGSYGSYDTFRGTADINVVGGPNHQVQFRFIADYRHGQNALGGPEGQKDINPTLYFHPSDTTTIYARFDYIYTDSEYGLTSIVEDNHNNLSTMHNYFVPLKDISGTPSWEWTYKYEAGANTSFEALGTIWNFRLNLRFNKTAFHGDETNMTGVNLINSAGATFATIANGGSLFDPRVADIQITRLERFEVDKTTWAIGNMDLVAQYDWGATRDIFDTYQYISYNEQDTLRYNYFLGPQDLLHPIQSPNIFAQLQGFDNIQINSDIHTIYYAWGQQDNLQLFDDRLVLVEGSRWDWGWQSTDNHLNTTSNAVTGGNDDAWTWKFGAVAKPIPTLKGLAVFWDHSETFQPQIGFLNNNPATPEKSLRGTMDEGGTKLELFDGRLTGTVSAFDGSLTNQIIQPPGVNGVEPPQIQEGTNTTTGWEGDLDIEPIPQVALLLGYTNLKSVDPNGNWVRDVPEGPNYKGLAKYTILDGPMKGLGAGFGYIFVSRHAGVAGATFILPSYDYSVAFLSYTAKTWRAQLNVNNVFNQAYAAGSTSNYEIYPGQQLNIKFTVTYLIK